jgi:hypothetical protein
MRGILFTLLLMVVPTSGFSGTTAADPVVQSGTINYAANKVTLTGTGFEPEKTAPTVEFDGTKLKVDSASNTKLVVTLPTAINAGTFSLVVGNSDGKSTTFDLTYGASGPQGAQGLEGPRGPVGPLGPQGPAGPAPAAKAFVVANQAADVNMPVEGQAYAVNSVVLPDAGTYIVQGQETLDVESTGAVCNLAASPVALRSLPPKGLTQSAIGPFQDETVVTIPIFGYYSTSAPGTTITLWCQTSGGEGYGWAHANGSIHDNTQSSSLLTAVQVK